MTGGALLPILYLLLPLSTEHITLTIAALCRGLVAGRGARARKHDRDILPIYHLFAAWFRSPVAVRHADFAVVFPQRPLSYSSRGTVFHLFICQYHHTRRRLVLPLFYPPPARIATRVFAAA